jgi:uncharacterized protein YndB with AHSA1/START domain
MEEKNRIVITRVFNAPVDMVWSLWTQAGNISKWWGPKGFHTKVKQHDFRPGGKWEYVMIDEAGKEYPALGIFKEIMEHKKITTSDNFGDDLKAATRMDLPQPSLFTTLFEDQGKKTKVTLIYEHASGEEKEKHLQLGVVGGWNSSLDKLEGLLIKP